MLSPRRALTAVIAAAALAEGGDALAALLASRRRLFVLTGAGCSTESGIPDYRDADLETNHRCAPEWVRRAARLVEHPCAMLTCAS